MKVPTMSQDELLRWSRWYEPAELAVMKQRWGRLFDEEDADMVFRGDSPDNRGGAYGANIAHRARTRGVLLEVVIQLA